MSDKFSSSGRSAEHIHAADTIEIMAEVLPGENIERAHSAAITRAIVRVRIKVELAAGRDIGGVDCVPRKALLLAEFDKVARIGQQVVGDLDLLEVGGIAILTWTDLAILAWIGDDVDDRAGCGCSCCGSC